MLEVKLNLKDGRSIIQDVEVFEGSGNIFQLIQKGLDNNGTLTLVVEGNVETKTWKDIKSLEIILP